jgi:hypothetical protein
MIAACSRSKMCINLGILTTNILYTRYKLYMYFSRWICVKASMRQILEPAVFINTMDEKSRRIPLFFGVVYFASCIEKPADAQISHLARAPKPNSGGRGFESPAWTWTLITYCRRTILLYWWPRRDHVMPDMQHTVGLAVAEQCSQLGTSGQTIHCKKSRRTFRCPF